MCYDPAMGRVERLPPPPTEPKRSPPVTVSGEEEVRVDSPSGGPTLEVRRHVPAAPRRAVVICHPHPLYGGSMHSPVPLAIAKGLSEWAERGVAWARFNFRGVGGSEGTYDDGRGEVDDARLVIEHLARATRGAPIAVCGHSFGSWVGLRAAAASVSAGAPIDRVLLVAPSTRFFAFGASALRFAGETTIFVGTEDELTDVAEARALGNELGAAVRVFEGFDHHFMKSRRALAEAARPILAPEAKDP
jgi:alpha/beta superfamily hydrolase